MADREALRDGVLALQDMNVGPTNGRRGDTREGIERTDFGNGLFVE